MTVTASARAAFWMAAVICACGAAVLVIEFAGAMRAFPGPAGLAVLLELPPLAAGFWIFRRLRPIRSPARSWSAAAVIWGMTAGTGCALVANQGLTAIWAKTAGIGFVSDWSAALSAPLNEEILKACGVVLIVLAAPLAIRGPLDGMVYGTLTGLGFQVIEDITYGLRAIAQSGATDPARAVASSALLRLGATALGSHWAMTAVAGAGIGYLAARGTRGVAPGLALLLAAIAMHLQFDNPHSAVPAKVAVNLTTVTVLYVVLRSSYLARVRNLVDAQQAFGMLTKGEAAPLLSRHGRHLARRRVPPGPQRDRLAARQRAKLAAIEEQAADLALLPPVAKAGKSFGRGAGLTG